MLLYELTQGEAPFADPKQTIRGIKYAKFPIKLTSGAKSIIQNLAKLQPAMRLGGLKGGFQDIFLHHWFDSFSWSQFNSLSMKGKG